MHGRWKREMWDSLEMCSGGAAGRDSKSVCGEAISISSVAEPHVECPIADRVWNKSISCVAKPCVRCRPRPNIAVIQLDQWRFDWDGYHAPALQLPAIRRLGDGGTRFERAYVPSPICVPSRVCFASGMAYRDIWVTSNGQDYVAPGSSPTFMSQLQGAGYATMFAGKDCSPVRHSCAFAGACSVDVYRLSEGGRPRTSANMARSPKHGERGRPTTTKSEGGVVRTCGGSRPLRTQV